MNDFLREWLTRALAPSDFHDASTAPGERESVRRSRERRLARQRTSMESRVLALEKELRSMTLLLGAFVLRAEEKGLMTRDDVRDVLVGLEGRAQADASARSLLQLGRSLGLLQRPSDEDLERARKIPTRVDENGETHVLVPEVGNETSGDVFKWLVAEGDWIDVAQPFVELTFDVATVEIPSPCAGLVTKLHGDVGAPMKTGAALISVEASSSDE